MSTTNIGAQPFWRRILPSATRTRIMGWVLLLVMAALGIVIFVTWRLLVSITDERMDAALRLEVEEFTQVTASGVNPLTGQPFASVEEVISVAIANNTVRPNEAFLGSVDRKFYTQVR